MDTQVTLFDDNPEYTAFVEKFKPKKTTDDCYTPKPVYAAVAQWVAKEYGLDESRFVRPFWPGGDYERFDYPEGCCVVDNPPFSILSKIISFYCGRGVPFFLFAPTLTLFASGAGGDCTFYPVDARITYANGALVNTSFVSNLDRRYRVRCAPELHEAVKRADAAVRAAKKAPALPKYSYPDAIITAAMARKYAARGVALDIPKDEAFFVREMDAQKMDGKHLFGGGFLLSERVAAEKAAAEKAAAEKAGAIVWHLSERERLLQQELNRAAEKRDEG